MTRLPADLWRSIRGGIFMWYGHMRFRLSLQTGLRPSELNEMSRLLGPDLIESLEVKLP